MSELTLKKGRPANTADRQEREIRTYNFLDSLGIEYERIDHPAAMTMEALGGVDEALGALVCKNLFLCNRQQTSFYMLMIPGDKVFKTKEISKQIGSAGLSFAPEDKMIEFLDIHPGSLSVMGLMNDHENNVRLLIDEDVLAADLFGCHPCVNTTSMRLAVKDLMEVFLPAVHHEPTVVRLGFSE